MQEACEIILLGVSSADYVVQLNAILSEGCH